MNIQLVVIGIVAAVMTAPAVLLVPRVRHSPVFDRVLWGATWLFSFLCGWYATSNFDGASLAQVGVVADVPALLAAIGAGAGAWLLNGLLWLLDRLAPVELPADEAVPASEVVNDGARSETES